MARLRVKKHFSLAFLGEEWKDCYIDFHAFTASDIKTNASIDPKTTDPAQVQESFNDMIKMLEDKFIAGKLPNEDGTVTDMKKEEIATLDMDILQGAVTFLSQGSIQN